MTRSIILVFVLSFAPLAGCEQVKSNPPKTGSISEPATTTSEPESTAEPTAPEAPIPEGSLSQAEAKEALRKERAGRDLALQTQPIDVEWARGVEGKLTAAFANLENGSVLKSVECRKTLCRLEFTHSSNGPSAQFGRTVKSRVLDAVSEDDGY